MIWLFVLRGLNLNDLIDGKYEGQHCGLGGVLGRRDRLSVDVNRGAQRGMPQQLLHDFEFRSHASQQRRVGVPKCVPANPPLDPESLRNRPDNPAENCLPPVRMASAMVLIRKNPVIGFAILAAVSPVNESRGENRVDRNRLLRCLGLASTYDAISDRTRHVHGALRKVDVAPLEGKQLTLTQAG